VIGERWWENKRTQEYNMKTPNKEIIITIV
jgi:hypothetical protein